AAARESPAPPASPGRTEVRPRSGQRDRIVATDDDLLHRQHSRPPRCEQGFETVAPGGTDREHAECFGRVDRRRRLVSEQIHLGEHDAVRLEGELRRVRGDLGAELVVLRLPVHGVDRDEEGEEARALDVAQKLESEPAPFVGALDDARNIGDDERAPVAQLYDAQVGAERGEGIVSDLRAGGRNHGKERGLARVRLADEADVGDELELELERAGFAVFARLVFARRLMRGGGEVGIAFAAAAAARDDDSLAVLEHFAEELRRCEISNYRSHGNGERHRRARASALVCAGAMVALLRRPRIAVGVVEERCEVAVADDLDVAAAAPVTAIGAAHRHELLAAEGDDARAPVARFHIDRDAIDEHGYFPRTRAQSRRAAWARSAPMSSATASITSSTTSGSTPTFRAPCRCEWSWRSCPAAAQAATMQSSRRARSSPGRDSTFP